MWSTRQVLHYQKILLRNAQQWLCQCFISPKVSFLPAVLSIYLLRSFPTYPLQKEKTKRNKKPTTKQTRETETETDRHSDYLGPKFSEIFTSLKFLQNRIPLWISSWADNIAPWITFMLFLFPSMKMFSVCQRPISGILHEAFSNFLN